MLRIVCEQTCKAKRDTNVTSADVTDTAASVYPRSIFCRTVPRYAVLSEVHSCH